MANVSKLKGLRSSGLGTPPSLDEARTDLLPSPPLETSLSPLQSDQAVSVGIAETPTSPVAFPERVNRMDGRTMRRTGRTIQFATRVSPEFDDRLRQIAMRDGILLVEVLERALDAYEGRKATQKSR